MTNVLIVGSGGREHAIAWKAAQSPRLDQLYIAPGNPGTASLGENILMDVDDHQAVAGFCKEKNVDLVIVGPETPLASGLADSLSVAGIRCFGPSREAAQIEASKVFAKSFMKRHQIPTARFAAFTKISEALAFIEQADYPVVIKASGLAAGKGVILPDTRAQAKGTLDAMLVNGTFGQAGSEVVIEERLSGQEVSLMAFTDGRIVVPMVPAQDHKRLLDGDQGPNTGGMGAYAPAPIFTGDLMDEALEYVLKPTVSGLREEGKPFVGVLYAGLMLTADGLRVLEFNCRFGDPETQAVLPLLETDLLEIVQACTDGNLGEVEMRWMDGAAVCVVLASAGYPEKSKTGKPIVFKELPEDVVCFHAGTKTVEGGIVTAGGRVLGLTARAENIDQAIAKVYANVSKVSFEGRQYRKDIAHHALKRSAYTDSGVSIDTGNRTVELIKEEVQSTYTPAVLAGLGSFGGLYDASVLKAMDSPVLVASTDGVGTKVKLAAAAGCYRGIGFDIVNHCVNDILVQGARPLFFLDYFATSKLAPEVVAEIVQGIASACKNSGVVLLGGETAEMPGVYLSDEFDLAGTIVGVVERENALPHADIEPGDVLLGLASSGPHTNGYSLIRRVFADTSLDTVYPEIGIPLSDALLAPHRSYLKTLDAALGRRSIKALAHLTGGGFIDNIPRVLPENVSAKIHLDSWPVPPLWNLIQRKGDIATDEMYRVFNMGIGMIAIVSRADVAEIQRTIPEPTYIVGELFRGQRTVELENAS